jgi:hypothetical protein
MAKPRFPLKNLSPIPRAVIAPVPEGLVIRRESTDWCESRAKLVRPDFTQAIDTHWRKRALEWNRIVNSSGISE